MSDPLKRTGRPFFLGTFQLENTDSQALQAPASQNLREPGASTSFSFFFFFFTVNDILFNHFCLPLKLWEFNIDILPHEPEKVSTLFCGALSK